ncbi:MAG: hypothetical protein LIO87_08065 [Eubacterium sp.]|nr:hypothetical protein [Eubacterium sp.]
MEEKRKSSFGSKVLKAVLIFVLIIVVAAAALIIWQRDNIISAYKGITLSSEDIASEIADSKSVSEEALSQYETPVLRDFTLEEEEMIRKGELTVEEAMTRILNEEDGESSSTQTETGSNEDTEVSGDTEGSNSSGSVSGSDSSKVDENTLVGNAVKKMYSLKAYYIGRLGSLEAEMKSEYMALSADQRSKSAISSILASHMGEVNALQAEADSSVAAVLSDLSAQLSSIGADTSIVSTLQTQYQNEKNLRKSYYVSTYLN